MIALTTSNASVFWRRLLYFGLVVTTTLGGVWLMFDIVCANGLVAIELFAALLFAIAFSLIVASFWTALIGFLVQLGRPIASAPSLSIAEPICTRTAIIMPVFNEAPERVFAGIEASMRSVEATDNKAAHFEFFLLSDTTDDAIAEQEQRYCRALRAKLPGSILRYRRRASNVGRKVGNIADFLERWGTHFDFMIVLDADSVMSGATMLKLVRMMQANPTVGIIQTVPLPVNQETLFARVIQFGSRLCSELLSAGQSFWLQDAGNYYGHNAIIRIKPFMEHCHMPTLPGSGPLAGEILSHDFVEAAFMRRAGWSVWNLPEGEGSYEEIPSNVLDYAKRDRRWSQGNLQHLRLLFEPGLHPISRLHFARGAMAYLMSPLWLILLLLGLAQVIAEANSDLQYFGVSYQLFPIWPVIKTTEAISLFMITMTMLLTPKLLGALLALSSAKRRAAFGGGYRLLGSLLLEIVFSALLAPVMMVFHSLFVISTLCGRSVSWNAQARGSRGLGLSEAFFYHKLQLLLGMIIFVIAAQIVPEHLWWLAPVLAGLLLSTPLAMLSSWPDIGRSVQQWMLLATPEEIQPMVELQTVRALLGMPVSDAGEAVVEDLNLAFVGSTASAAEQIF